MSEHNDSKPPVLLPVEISPEPLADSQLFLRLNLVGCRPLQHRGSVPA